ncbi:MAG: NYN domain-containing protein [Chloroflexota bacterium]
MSHNIGVFVDVSNLFYSAKSAGVEVNYCRLLDLAVAGRDLIRACAYTGVDPDNPNQRKFIDFLRANGYKVVCKDIHKYEGGRIKANLDIEMAVDIMLLSENLDVVVIVSGDGDFVRLIEATQMKGVRCEVISFGISTSNELIEAADQFTEISSLPGIFRNSPSGSSIHLRPVVQSGAQQNVAGMYAYRSVSYNATYQLPADKAQSQPWDNRDQRSQAQIEMQEQRGTQPAAYEYAANQDFGLPEGEPCIDPHSIPLPRPASVQSGTPNGHEQ